jgi:hypothetical protein
MLAISMYQEWIKNGYTRVILAAEFRKLSYWIHRAVAEQNCINKRLAFAMAFHASLWEDSSLGDIADMSGLIVPYF